MKEEVKQITKNYGRCEQKNGKWSICGGKEKKRRKSEIESFKNKIRLSLSGEKNENDKVNDSEKLAKQSGSLEWSKKRGEI